MKPAHIIATKIAKKNFNGNDRGKSLLFQEFMQSWVGYNLVKVLHVFGLQPTVRKDINEWSEDLFETFAYLSNKNNEEYKESTLRVLDIIFDKTDNNSYFTKLNFGSKEKIKSVNNYTLHLVVLTWLRQLQQFFFAQKKNSTKGDRNKYGKYWGTSSLAKKHHPLTNINMA
jgi:hypothetical protein